jgi:hypothetical protein
MQKVSLLIVIVAVALAAARRPIQLLVAAAQHREKGSRDTERPAEEEASSRAGRARS